MGVVGETERETRKGGKKAGKKKKGSGKEERRKMERRKKEGRKDKKIADDQIPSQIYRSEYAWNLHLISSTVGFI